MNYNSGDIVRVFYPYLPKVKDTSGNSAGKVRYGLVINAGSNQTVALPILAITSHRGKTRGADYILRDDEVRIPDGVSYFKRSKGEVPIDGVIKTERIEFFDDDEISKPLTSVNLDTKIEVLERYKNTMDIPYFVRKMNEESPGHKEAMQTFERATIAEKLGFLATDLGECKYEHMEDFVLKLYKIQPLGQSNSNKRIHFGWATLSWTEKLRASRINILL
ncbi:hypothetical protein M5W75_12525 [Paenibacillus larvae]|uniref:hypothetical protein n=2 Tax=Paenibacillus larvae TaxID=1464 RepID=UPI002281A6A5|nr:hypothetical protein [Paenibacillus larvae]MCY9750655.1 hypothetical protein [Paenibacillus larvae]